MLPLLLLVARADESSLLAPAAPLEEGLELRGGAGLGRFVLGGEYVLFPAIQLAARYAPTENIELALPLIVSASARLPIGGRPIVAASVGAVAIGYDSLRGAYFTPSVDVSLHFVNRRTAVFVVVGVRSDAIGAVVQDLSPTGFVRAGWMVLVTETLAVGFSSEFSLLLDVVGNREALHIEVGSPLNGPHSTVPAIRWALTDSVAIDGWIWVDAARFTAGSATFAGLATVAGELSVTWSPRF